MSNLSRTEHNSPGQSPSPLVFVAAYLLWFFALAASTLVALALRDLLQMGMVLTTWNRYAVHAVNQFATLALILALVVVFISLEGYFRNGATKGDLTRRFWLVAAFLLGALALIQGVRLLLEISTGFINLYTALVVALLFVGAYGSRQRARRDSVGARQPSQTRTRPLSLDTWLSVGLVAIGAFLLYLPIKFPLNLYDEGLALVGGLRVARGDVPFRDFWAIYPPGQAYLLGALFRLAEPTVMVERLVDTVVRFGVAFGSLTLATKLLPNPRWSFAPYLSVVVILAAATFYGYAMFPALLCALLSLLLWVHYVEKRQHMWLVLSGLAIGVTALFRIDVAVYTGLAIAVGLTTFRFGIDTEDRGFAARVKNLLGDGLVLSGSALIVVVPLVGYLSAVAGFEGVWTNLIVFPATVFHDVRHLPYPPLWPDWVHWRDSGIPALPLKGAIGDWLRFYLPIAVLTATALVLVATAVRRYRRGRYLAVHHGVAVSLTVLGCGLFVQALSRYDAIHVLPTSLCVVLLVAWLGQQVPAGKWQRALFAVTITGLFFVSIVLYVLDPYATLNEHVRRFPPAECYSEIPAASCVPLIQDQAEMLALLADYAGDSDAVFVGLQQHDRIFINDVGFYFLSDHPIPTRYHELHPGVATTAPIQQEIIAELEETDVPWIVLVDWPNPEEKNGSATSSGIHLLDEYIRAAYVRTRQVGMYQLWQRDD